AEAGRVHRKVSFEGGALVVADWADRAGPLSSAFLFAPGLEIRDLGDCRFEATRDGRPVCLARVQEGLATRIEERWHAPTFGTKRPARALVVGGPAVREISVLFLPLA
ncbi:MAG: hypothetical protein H3C58_15160, partial [Fimbriimonadaceae bacterium]|nr:hypothetical protein [Fimbriimonadaceae bacterium]